MTNVGHFAARMFGEHGTVYLAGGRSTADGRYVAHVMMRRPGGGVRWLGQIWAPEIANLRRDVGAFALALIGDGAFADQFCGCGIPSGQPPEWADQEYAAAALAACRDN